MAAEIDILQAGQVLEDLCETDLLERAIIRGEGTLSSSGALVVTTGERTGRSPADRFIVQDASTQDQVDWGSTNQPIDPAAFDALWDRVGDYLDTHEVFLSHLHVGADPQHYLPVEVTTEYAWHAIFAQHIFIQPNRSTKAKKSAGKFGAHPGSSAIRRATKPTATPLS